MVPGTTATRSLPLLKQLFKFANERIAAHCSSTCVVAAIRHVVGGIFACILFEQIQINAVVIDSTGAGGCMNVVVVVIDIAAVACVVIGIGAVITAICIHVTDLTVLRTKPINQIKNLESLYVYYLWCLLSAFNSISRVDVLFIELVILSRLCRLSSFTKSMYAIKA